MQIVLGILDTESQAKRALNIIENRFFREGGFLFQIDESPSGRWYVKWDDKNDEYISRITEVFSYGKGVCDAIASVNGLKKPLR